MYINYKKKNFRIFNDYKKQYRQPTAGQVNKKGLRILAEINGRIKSTENSRL